MINQDNQVVIFFPYPVGPVMLAKDHYPKTNRKKEQKRQKRLSAFHSLRMQHVTNMEKFMVEVNKARTEYLAKGYDTHILSSTEGGSFFIATKDTSKEEIEKLVKNLIGGGGGSVEGSIGLPAGVDLPESIKELLKSGKGAVIEIPLDHTSGVAELAHRTPELGQFINRMLDMSKAAGVTSNPVQIAQDVVRDWGRNKNVEDMRRMKESLEKEVHLHKARCSDKMGCDLDKLLSAAVDSLGEQSRLNIQ